MKATYVFVTAISATLIASGCSQSGAGMPATPPNAMQNPLQFGGRDPVAPAATGSVLEQLHKQVVIGSTIDPVNGGQNPYGLTVAPVTAGKFTAGDLVVCNFNAKSNVQGTGRSIVALHPMAGSKPLHVSSDKTLLGCDALALGSDDTIWASSMVANDNPVLDVTGKLITNISGKPFSQPWGQIFAAPQKGAPAFYETNAHTGSVVRINLGSKFTYDVIATGFPVNHGQPGTALAPSGLAYDPKVDTLYFADGKNDTVVAFKGVTKIPAPRTRESSSREALSTGRSARHCCRTAISSSAIRSTRPARTC